MTGIAAQIAPRMQPDHSARQSGLPPLREELSLHAGAPLATGEPCHVLEDPVRNQFFRIDWLTFEILKRWSLDDPEAIADSICTATPLQPEAEDVSAVVKFLSDNELLRPDPLTSASAMAQRHDRMQGTWAKRLLHNYLFFRIPLVRPDRWLSAWAPAFAWIYTSTFMRLTLLALLAGGVQIYRDWDRFTATLADTFTPAGLMAYGLALIGVKCAHELGHAITAKRLGCKVPTMGIAFLVLWPVPYTDTNDAWRLNSNLNRQRIAAAGVATELIIAIWSTLAWTLLPDGFLRALVFPLATTTWIATLAINASPFMRFDGYFLLSDWLDMPNLHARAFALARWHLRECLFALNDPPPEYLPHRRHTGLILFAWATWLYRLSLFIGIAILVYHFFIKIIGIALFIVEVVFFILKPIASELTAWRSLWPRIKTNRRGRIVAMLLAVLLMLLIVPLPTRIQTTGVLRASAIFPVHAPDAAQVQALPWREGAQIKAGEVLVQLTAARHASQLEALRAEVEQLEWQSASSGFDAEQRQRATVLREELATARARLEDLLAETARYAPVAPFDGQLRDMDPELTPGTWVGKNTLLGVLVGKKGHQVNAYLDEETVRRIRLGDTARFYTDGLEGPVVRLSVTAIDQDATRVLPAGFWAAQLGGAVQAREKAGYWYPEKAVYRVTFRPEESVDALAPHAWRGKVVIAGEAEAPAMRFIRHFLSVLLRESGF